MAKLVSLIIPCRNEAGTIVLLLEGIRNQTFPADQLEVIVIDGTSTDGTRELVRATLAEAHRDLSLRLADNPARSIPAALNRGVQSSTGAVVIRLDAHSVPEPDYIDACVETLHRTGAANVGGVWEIKPAANTWIGRSIAAAAGHPLGAGDAKYRIRGGAGAVETVPFGAYPRIWLDRVGPFNEQLLTNEDYEYNLRIRRAGGVVWFDPKIRSTYFARARLTDLAGQYLRYGYWKGRMLARNFGSIRWRQALPPLFVLALLALAVLSRSAPEMGLAVWQLSGVYFTILVGSSVVAAIRARDLGRVVGMPLAFMAMHFCWGLAFWFGLGSGAALALIPKR